jgi:hypothetical protein
MPPAGVSIAWVMQFLPASILFKEPRSANGLLNFPGNDKMQAPVEFILFFGCQHMVSPPTPTTTPASEILSLPLPLPLPCKVLHCKPVR